MSDKKVSVERMHQIAETMQKAAIPCECEEDETETGPTAWINIGHRAWLYRDGCVEAPEQIDAMTPVILRGLAVGAQVWRATV